MAAVMEQDEQHWALVNANTLDQAAQLKQPAAPMDYGGESNQQRITRRKSRWTPAAHFSPAALVQQSRSAS